MLAPPAVTGAVVAALRVRGWLRRGRSVCSHGDDEKAVFLNAAGAAALARADAAATLGVEGVTFAPGLRVGSRPCGGPRGQQTNSAIYLLRATEASRTRAEGSFRFAELFAGLGGFRVALEALGGEAAFASEIDPHACSTYAANFGDVPHGDITEIDADDVPDHDVLTAGFPCQRFSVAGDGAGFSEDRLFFEVIRILEVKQPRLAILENVEGLDGFARRVVVEALALVGYRAEHRVVDALALLPQRRARLYVVARRRDVAAAPFVWPRCLATRDRCASPDAAFGRRCLCRRVSRIVGARCAVRDVLEAAAPADAYLTAAQASVVASTGADAATRRLAWLDGAARTLMSNYRQGFKFHSEFVPGEPPRFYTRREAARIMGFPDAFDVDSAGTVDNSGANRAYHQIGNACCPPVVCALAAPALTAVGLRSSASCDDPAPEVLELLGASAIVHDAPRPACAPRPAGFRTTERPLVIVVHAFGGHPEKFWYPELAAALADDACVEVLRMTDPATPRIDAWVGDLERRMDEAAAANRAVYFVGHSVGCQAIVRYLATPAAASLLAGESLRLGGVLCVAAWFSVVDPWATIEPWCATPIDTGAARRVIEGQGASLVVLLSDDDKYTPDHASNSKLWQDRLGATTRTLPGAGHFGRPRQPQIVAAVRDMLK